MEFLKTFIMIDTMVAVGIFIGLGFYMKKTGETFLQVSLKIRDWLFGGKR